MDLKIKKIKVGGNSKKARQSAHNRLTRKYERQRVRTENRKAHAVLRRLGLSW